MNKWLYMMTVVMLCILVACSNDEDYNQAEQNKIEINVCKSPEFFVTSGHSVLNETTHRAKTRTTSDLLTYTSTTYAWEYPLDIFEHFPEFVTPKGYYEDFLYVSNGEPFDLVMLYSNGNYRHKMGIFWYEDGECHEQQLWDEMDDINNQTWVNFDGADSKGEISRKADNAGAYTIQLPKGIRFGFYCHSTNKGEEIIEYIRLKSKFADLEPCIYKFYTEQAKNWSYVIAERDHYTLKSQAMTTTIKNWTIVGFEDRSLTYPGCDKDYNDCVFALNPQQHIEGESVDGAVEVNLSVNNKHDNGDFIATKLSIHVRTITDTEVFLPVEKKYYCEADDMNIVASHKELEFVYNTTPQYVEMNIGGSIVKFIVTYEENGIRITTDGINKDVIEYCQNTYKDGITFEVWNYFNELIDRETLKGMIDNSTVEFLDNQPQSYVNAFGRVDGLKNPWDCTVKPTNQSYKESNEEAGAFNVKYTI